MKKILFFATFLLLSSTAVFSQGSTIGSAEGFCSDTGYDFANTSNAGTAESGPNYSCLSTVPNPSWFIIKIDTPGDLTLQIEQNSQVDFTGTGIDVDFICWGPFTQAGIDAIQAGDLSALSIASPNPNEVDCSYSPNAIEELNIRAAQVDEFYLILITNFDNQPGFIRMQELNPGQVGTGSTDCSIVDTALGPNQNVCFGTPVTLDATPTTGTATGYKWFLDTGAGYNEMVGETSAMLLINNNQSGLYKVEVTAGGGDVAEDEIEILFFNQPVANAVTNPTYEICDDDYNGTVSFDLQTLFASDVLGAQDPAIFEVVFFANQADADANTNPLPNPYINTNATETIFARAHNTASPLTCNAATTSFTITVNPLPQPVTPINYELCDDATDGDDTNGFVNNFMLSSKDTEILDLLNPADYTVSYHTSLVGAQTSSVTDFIDKTMPYTNIVNGETVYIRVQNNTTGCATTPGVDTFVGTFNLVVNPLPVITTPVTLSLCDTDQDGITNFNLTTANGLLSANAANETFTYYPTLADVQGDTNAIPNFNAYPNVTDTNDMVWARVITVNGCYRIAQINLVVSTSTIPVTFTRTYAVCDDYNGTAGSDLDGITSFNFSTVDAEMVALFPAAQSLTISHFTSQADAIANTNAIVDISNHRNTGSANTQQIYTRVVNTVNATCLYIDTHITLNVDPVPMADAVVNLELCDDNADGDDTNGIVQSFDLESQTATILGTQNPADYTVTYHTSATDALNGANNLSSPYANTSNNQTIFVRVTNNTTNCYTDHTTFDLIVHPLPVYATTDTVDLKQCDDDTDGFSDFNLTEANILISADHLNETFVYYPTLADAQADSNAIVNPIAFTNRTTPTDIVWARAITVNGCYRIAQVNLIVSTTGIPATFARTFNTCDDFLPTDGVTGANDDTDGVALFDFSSVDADVRALFPITQQLTITYYRNNADALAEQNAITDIANYRNIGYPGSQSIFIRVDSNLDNGCLGFGPYITLNVDPVPVANPVGDYALCETLDDGDGTNGIIQTFDLESQTATILGTQNPANYTVTYHASAADALNGVANLTSPYTNTTRDRQTIYVRVTGSGAGCFTNHTFFDIVVDPLPVANFVADLEICDDNTDGSARNGFSQNIDLESQTAGILGTQDPTQFTVTYHRDLAEAQAGTNPQISPFSNTTPNRQTIYVRVYNSITQCVNGISNFDVVVNPEPIFDTVSNLSVCDDDADGDDANGFVQDIDLNSQIPDILGPTQDPDDFNVTFHESQAEATSGMNPFANPFSNTIANQQTIYVRIQNKATGCVNDDANFEVIVNPLPDFQVTTPQIVCLNGPTLTIRVENPADIYDYVWTDPNNNNIVGSFLTVSSGGLYTITATTTNGTGCTRTRTIQVNESIIATITQDDVTIVDDSDNNSITIDPTNLGIGDYEYALSNENNVIIRSYQDSPIFDRLEGGFYNILVRDKNGCGEVSLLVSVVEFPKFFTPNNDGINDTWIVKGANSTFFPESAIYIFNRFGKVVANIPIDSQGWTGDYGGNRLPSDDYWFTIKLIDPQGEIRERKGNFSLLRK